MMKFTGSINDIVPHDLPMLLLDRYISSNETGLVAEIDIHEHCPFFEIGNGVPAYVGVEYIAQAISAFNGLSDFISQNKVSPGFLLGSRKIELHTPYFRNGSTVTVTVEESFNDGGMAVFDGQVIIDGKSVIEARLSAYQPEDPMEFMDKVKEQKT